MSFGQAFDAKDQVRQAIDIVDLVGGYMQLRRQGRNFVGICPWHDDSRPSLQVNPDRQSFKCWVCDYGGDVFSFIMRAEGLEFREALEMLAERAGVQLHTRSNESGGGQYGDMGAPRPEDDKRTLYRALAWAEEQFHRCLLGAPEAQQGRDYLAARGITDQTIRRFHVGFAPNRWDWVIERARGSEWTPAILERIGLLRRKELGGGHYDWFRGRVMFSIRDARSRPIAFGGRVLPQLADDKSAKYINSPETPLFSKSRELYALDVACENFKSEGGAIVMEGYTDVLMAQQNGVNNCVAVLGTALGERHLKLLKHYTERVTLVLDGDDAGRRRTNEILDALLSLFEKNEVDLRILTLPEGIDPCDFIATHGSDSFRALLAQAVDPLEHKFRSVTNGLDTLTDTHRASQAAEQLLATLAKIRPSDSDVTSHTLIREQQTLSRIARQFHLPEEKLRGRLTAIRQEARGKQSTRSAFANTPDVDSSESFESAPVRMGDLQKSDRDLLELVILDPTYIPRLAASVDPAAIISPVARRIFLGCCRLAEQDMHGDFGRIMAAFDDPAIKNLLVELDEAAILKVKADRERWFADLLVSHQRNTEERARRTRLAAARQNDDDALQLLAQYREQSRQKHLSDYERKKK